LFMKETNKRNQYFQVIAHRFLEARGAPFFLSSKDIDLITTWEKMGIPLKVVLEGMGRTFENYRAKPGERQKIHSLVFCKLQVLKAFEQFKERKVGSHKSRYEREKKRKIIKGEVQRFLSDIPSPLSYLEEIYVRALKILSRRDVKEEELERLEEEIEEFLFKNCPQRERERVKRDILEKYPFKEKDEFHSIFRIKLIKTLREMYKVPHISFFYY